MMRETTEQGNNIADQILSYGNISNLTIADVWNILDRLFTHFSLDVGDPSTMKMIGKWMDELEEINEDLPL